MMFWEGVGGTGCSQCQEELPLSELQANIDIFADQVDHCADSDRVGWTAMQGFGPSLPIAINERSEIGEIAIGPLGVCGTEEISKTGFGSGVEDPPG